MWSNKQKNRIHSASSNCLPFQTFWIPYPTYSSFSLPGCKLYSGLIPFTVTRLTVSRSFRVWVLNFIDLLGTLMLSLMMESSPFVIEIVLWWVTFPYLNLFPFRWFNIDFSRAFYCEWLHTQAGYYSISFLAWLDQISLRHFQREQASFRRLTHRSIGHFRVPLCLGFKASLSAKPFL